MQTKQGNFKAFMAVIACVLFAVGLPAYLWLNVIQPAFAAGGDMASIGTMGWYIFSYVMGLTMIVMPCTLPLAFVIVPMSNGKGLHKGLGIALAFGAGVALMLSTYGAIVALLGKAGISFLGAEGEDVKNWIYFFAGIFAYIFALGEIGLVKFRMPSYTGSAPDFIQKRKDYLKAFLLGLFLGNIGVGCPHPATPVILIEIASSGNVFYGWTLFLIHAIGRVVPLVILAVLAALGVNGLSWLVKNKDKIERANGWAMVFVAGFILTLGLFTHDWWVNSGQHNLLEKVTQEHYFNQTLNEQLNTEVAHAHGLEEGVGIFGQPLEWGNYFIVFLWILPLWWFYVRERRRVYGVPGLQLQKLEHKRDRLEEERRSLEIITHIPDSEQGTRVKELEAQIDLLEKERRIIEEAVRYGSESGLRAPEIQQHEELALALRRNWYVTLSVLLITVFAIFLPFWFVNFESQKGHGAAGAHDAHGAPATAVQTVPVATVLEALQVAPLVLSPTAVTRPAAPVHNESVPHMH